MARRNPRALLATGSGFNLTQAKTRAYVGVLLSRGGTQRDARLTAPVLKRRVKKMTASLTGAAVLKKVRSLRAMLDESERQEVATEIEHLQAALRAIARELRGRSRSGQNARPHRLNLPRFPIAGEPRRGLGSTCTYVCYRAV